MKIISLSEYLSISFATYDTVVEFEETRNVVNRIG